MSFRDFLLAFCLVAALGNAVFLVLTVDAVGEIARITAVNFGIVNERLLSLEIPQ